MSFLTAALAAQLQDTVPPGQAKGKGSVVLTDSRERYPLGLEMEILEDPEKAWTIDDVTAPELTRRFLRGTEPVPNFGATDSALWVRFSVRNETNPEMRWLLLYDQSQMERIDLYLPTAEGRYDQVFRTGFRESNISRDVSHRRFVFDLPFLHGQARAEPPQGTIYMRFEGALALILPLELIAESALLERDHQTLLMLGSFYGILLILIGYNLYLFLLLRDASHGLFAAHLSFMVLIFAIQDGVFSLYLWPQTVPARAWFTMTAGSLAMGFLILFMWSFLQTKIYAPMLHKASGVLLISVGVVGILSPFGRYQHLTTASVILISAAVVLFLLSGARVFFKGYRPARLFCLAWIVTLAGDIFQIYVHYDLVPGTNLDLAELIMRIGHAGQGFILSLALADRIHLTRWEKEKAEKQLAHSQHRMLDMQENFNRQLEARSTELEEFYYSLWHDIKNPIVTIRGFTGAIERAVATTGKARLLEDSTRIRDAAGTLQQLVEGLARLSRLDRMPSSAAVKLNEIVEEAVRGLSEALSRGNIEVEITGTLPVVQGDRQQLTDVLRILIDNAIRHMGDVHRPRLRIGTRQKGVEVASYVEDNGPGIDPRFHEKIFGLFERLSAEGEGTGIGLAQARRIVEMHGGRIWVESDGPGTGSTFLFILPEPASAG